MFLVELKSFGVVDPVKAQADTVPGQSVPAAGKTDPHQDEVFNKDVNYYCKVSKSDKITENR